MTTSANPWFHTKVCNTNEMDVGLVDDNYDDDDDRCHNL
jgi:hypothetical protein